MNPYRFNRLPIERRARLVSQSGQLLAKGYQECYSKALYHMGGFFVEVWCSAVNNHVVSIRGFEGNTCLGPYLDMIDLGELKK